MNKIITIGLIGLTCLGISGCDQPSADNRQRQAQEQIELQGAQTVGMPAIHRFFEKRVLKEIYELRDQADHQTYTYYLDMNGNKHKLCNSIGYGIPYATQYTNPQKPYSDYSNQTNMIDQADPNGLFSPPSAEGTWILCTTSPDSTNSPTSPKKVVPLYVEPRIIVSPFELN